MFASPSSESELLRPESALHRMYDLAGRRSLQLPQPRPARNSTRGDPNSTRCRAGEPELLRPEGTANPSLHRMYDLLAARALDANAPVPDAGPVAARLSAPSLADGLPTAAADALAALPDAFSITERVRIRAHHELVCLFVGPGRVLKGLGLPTEAGSRLQIRLAALPDAFSITKRGAAHMHDYGSMLLARDIACDGSKQE